MTTPTTSAPSAAVPIRDPIAGGQVKALVELLNQVAPRNQSTKLLF
jgi:hypothetical protein